MRKNVTRNILKTFLQIVMTLVFRDNQIEISGIGKIVKIKKTLLEDYQLIYFLSYKNKFVKKVINTLKYYRPIYLFEFFGKQISKIIPDQSRIVLVPVPMSRKRLIERGYNHSELLAKKTKELLGDVLFLDNLVIKNKETVVQKSIKQKNKRFENVKNSFDLNKKYLEEIRDKDIYIIDDVLSSGATALEIIKLLKPYVKSIKIIVIAH